MSDKLNQKYQCHEHLLDAPHRAKRRAGSLTRALKHKREREQTKTLEELRNKYV